MIEIPRNFRNPIEGSHTLRHWITLARTGQLRKVFREEVNGRVREAVRRKVADVRPATLPLHGIQRSERVDIQNRIRRALYRDASIRARRKFADELWIWSITPLFLIALIYMAIVHGAYFLLGLTIWYAAMIPSYLIILACIHLPRPVALTGILTVVAYQFAGPIAITIIHFGDPSLTERAQSHFSTSDTTQNFLSGLENSATIITGLLFAYTVGHVLTAFLTRHWIAKDETFGPYDHSISEWAGVLRCLVSAAPIWPTRKSMKQTVDGLGDLAATIESELSVSWLRPLTPRLLPQLNSDAHRISACIRQNQGVLLRYGHGEEFDRVIESLSDGLVSLALGSRERLLANTPEIARRAIAKDAFKRAYPGFIFLAAGILLPLVPQIADQGDVASKVRIAFIVMGVLAIASAPADAANKVNEAIAKVLPIGKP